MKIKLILLSVLMSATSYASDVGIYRAVAPTIEEAQIIVDGINNGDIRVHDCAGGKGEVYKVELPPSPTTTRVNRFGKIEVVPAKTVFKVQCDFSRGDR